MTCAPGNHPSSLGERLRGARRQQLVGRTGEVEVFRSALLAPADPVRTR
ncbi:hypothetical protein [Pseudonocardia aurantiaca]|uniref:Uncharacterized protein n=1 Tax=Pseudonocardia aurantiaca TaxID=75290 RepID=A0ABW4FHT2_9PSEU